MLRRGDSGKEVTNLQELLVQAGHCIKINGKFGPQTEIAVKKFQRANGLKADGIAGPLTFAALYAKRPEEAEEGTGKMMVVTAGGLNLRSGPGVTYRLIRELPAGTEAELMDDKKYGIYQKIRPEGSPEIGYGWSQRLIDKEAAIVVPVLEGVPYTEHFTMSEWESRCKIGTDKSKYSKPIEVLHVNLQTLMNALEELHRRLIVKYGANVRIIIHSGYRTYTYHLASNPNTNSMHCLAGAADISMNGDTTVKGLRRVALVVREMYDEGIFGGFGYGYNCIHVDMRGRTGVDGKIIQYGTLSGTPALRNEWRYNGIKDWNDYLKKTA